MIIVGMRKKKKYEQWFCRHQWKKVPIGGLRIEWKPHSTIKSITIPILKETWMCTKYRKEMKKKVR